MDRKYVIIVAGGKGERAGGDIPKQFHDLNGRPLLWWSMKAFIQEDSSTNIILVLPQKHSDIWERLYKSLPLSEQFPYSFTFGGASRWESVKNGLSLVPKGEDVMVAVHDGARPLIPVSVIQECWKVCREKDGVVPVIPLTDSIRKKIDGNEHTIIADRSRYMAVQTPQCFHADTLHKAYSLPFSDSFTDDASVVEAYGRNITVVPGNSINMKVTNPQDFAIAECLMQYFNNGLGKH